MKRLLITAIVAFAALPVIAGDEKKPPAQTPPAGQQTQPAPVDSPLVRAAKATKRGKSKRPVITNETLKTAKGHITTTNVTKVANPPAPAPSVELELRKAAVAEREAAQARQAAEKKAADKRAEELRQKAAAAEEDSLFSEEDPAQVEHRLEQTSTQPQEKKP